MAGPTDDKAVSEQRLARVARRLSARSSDMIYRSPTGGVSVPAESVIDGVARSLAAPISRRRAVAVIGGSLLVSTMLRPGSARATVGCPAGGPRMCTSPGSTPICVPANLECCSNALCAAACGQPWESCIDGHCQDTPRLCTRINPAFTPDLPKYCSMVVDVAGSQTCGDPPTIKVRKGWCCPKDQLCGTKFGDCVCPPAQECGDECCAAGKECVKLGFLRGRSCLPVCRPGFHHDAFDCVCDAGQTCGVRCCPEGTLCSGSSCIKPTTPPKDTGNPLSNMLDMINEVAGSRSGSHARDVGTAASASAPVNAALLALAAVNVQGAAAGLSFNDDHLDPSYRSVVAKPRPRLAALGAGPGLDPRAASALNALLAAEAKGNALALASATALARARGAAAHHNQQSMRKQVLSAAGFADQAAKALRAVPSLRAKAATTLTSTGTAEVVASSGDAAAVVQAGGLPSELSALLKGLGVPGADLQRVSAALPTDASGGPVLIAPLQDAQRARLLRNRISLLAQFAKAARRSPLQRSRRLPQRYTPR